MLRDMKFLSGSAPRALRWGMLLCVTAVTLVTIGIRPPMGAGTQLAVAAQEKPKTAPILPETRGVTLGASDGSVGAGSGKNINISGPEPLNPQYVPADALMVVAARPEAVNQFVRSFNATKALPEDVPNPLEEFANCEQLSLVVMYPAPGVGLIDRSMVWCLTFASAEACDLAANNMVSRVKAPGQVFQFLWKEDAKSLRVKEEVMEPHGYARAIIGERTLLFGGRDAILKMIGAGSQSQSHLTTTDGWKAASSGSVAIAVDAAVLGKLMSQAPPNPITAMLSPLWNSAVGHTLGIEIGDRVQLKLTSLANDAAGARKLGNTLSAGMTMLSGMLSSFQNAPDSKLNAAAEPLLSILEKHRLEQQDNQITLSLDADLVTVFAAIVPPLLQARTAAQQTQHRNNVKMIMLAMHNYHDVTFGDYSSFPMAAGVMPNRKHPRSWRVELLPFLEQADLYQQYKDEPWDSEANLKVLAKMPAVFRHPSQPANSTTTSYVAAYGKGLLFEPNAEKGTRIQDVTDGCSNTIAILEAKTDIPWTKPEDILIDVTQDTLPKFGGFDDTGFVVGIADGSVRRISTSLEVNLLKHLFTISGGEVVPANY